FIGYREQAVIYRDPAVAEICKRSMQADDGTIKTTPLDPKMIQTGLQLLWDGNRVEVINAGETAVVLQRPDGAPQNISRSILEEQARCGKLFLVKSEAAGAPWCV